MSKKANTEEITNESSRRSFLSKLWIALGCVALAEFIAVAFAFLRPGKPTSRPGNTEAVVSAGAVDQFVPNSVTAFVRGRFYLARLEDGGFLALSRKCTHLGCTVPWLEKERHFACPCHASVFDINGNVINAPAPRAMDIYPVTIENGMVKVDTNKAIKRTDFRDEQVTHPTKQL